MVKLNYQPPPIPIIEMEENGSVGGSGDGSPQEEEVIELSSGSESDSSSDSSSASNSGSDSETGGVLLDIQQMNRVMQDKLELLEGKMKRKRRRTSSTKADNSLNEFLPEENAALKMKLSMVMEELEKSRMSQAKRLRAGRPRPQMVIEVPDFPMEFYGETSTILWPQCSLPAWFDLFNEHPIVRNYSEYSAWINGRVTDNLHHVLKIITSLNTAPPLLQQHDVLKLRSVSKSWNTQVDKFLQDNAFGISTIIKSSDKQRLLGIVERTLELQRSKCPFPSRSVVVQELVPVTPGFSVVFKDAMNVLLQMHGPLITHFTYVGFQDPYLFADNSSSGEGFWMVKKWLERMHNLKSFSLKLPQAGGLVTVPVEQLPNIPLPLPRISSLTTVHFHGVTANLVNSALLLNPSVRTLQTTPSMTDVDHVKRLQGSITNFSLIASNPEHVMALQSGPWDLTSLSVKYTRTSVTNSEFPSFPTIILILEQFANSLTTLNLDAPAVGPPLNPDTRLVLPLLTNLTIRLTESQPISYDFLISLTSLEFLHITITSSYQDPCPHDLVHLRGYLDRLYESNIWRLFPHLKSAVVVFPAQSPSGEESLKKLHYSRYEAVISDDDI